MKRAILLGIILTASAAGMLYRSRADYRILRSAESATAARPLLHSIPSFAGYDALGQPVPISKDADKIVLFVLHRHDQNKELQFWQRVFSGLGNNRRVVVVGVRDSAAGDAPLSPDPRLLVVTYADYIPLSFLADLNRRSQVAVFDKHWTVLGRFSQSAGPEQAEEALK